jgi:iron-sulfur cluster repair protein YtfE (RIC family)
VGAYLENDHRVIDAILKGVEGLILERNVPAAAEAFRAFRRRLDSHIAAEEMVLFPVFEEVTACNGPTSVMRSEHADIQRLMAAIRVSLEGPEHCDPVLLIQELARTLGSHNAKEERILYPKTDAGLSSVQRDELVSRIEFLIE